MNVLVLGVGNILLQDEGVGVHAVDALQNGYDLPAGVEVIDGGTSGMDLLEIIAGRDHLIVVDAVKTGQPPGTVVRLGSDQVRAFFRTKISPHQLGLSDVLASATLSGEQPREVSLIGMVPHSVDTGLELSALAMRRLRTLVDMTVAELCSLGLAPEPRLLDGTHVPVTGG